MMRHLFAFGLPLVMMVAGLLTAALITGRRDTIALAMLIVLGFICLVIGTVSYRFGLRFGQRTHPTRQDHKDRL
jgi:ABC-type transport system involved in cytochrome bd biosynthesis fused ATPase/permease subunit